MLYEIKGDLIKLAENGLFDVIIHGCNTYHNFSGGIAYGIREVFPRAYRADLETVYGIATKLGTYSSSLEIVPRNLDFVGGPSIYIEHEEDINKTLIVANAYTQYRPGKDLKIWALAASLARICNDFPGAVFGLPLIACGIAGGDWDEIKKIIDTIFYNENIIVVHYDK